MMGDEALPDVDFAVIMPLVKSIYQPDGSISVDGVASDPSLDLELENLDQDSIAKSFGYLRSHGKFNWDHGKDDIGDIFSADRITAAEAAKEFGVTIDPAGGTYIGGNIYPLGDPTLAPEDLKTAHHRCQVGARLGMSLQGICRRKPGSSLVEAVIVPKVALTPSPTHPNAVARVRLAKSLSEIVRAMQGEQVPPAEEAGSADPGFSWLLVSQDLPLVKSQRETPEKVTIPTRLFLGLVKSAAIMEAGSGVNAAEYRNGRALMTENLESKPQRVTPSVAGECVCEKCGYTMAHERGKPCRAEKCPKCGAPMARRIGEEELQKAMQVLEKTARLQKAAKKRKRRKPPLGSGERFAEIEQHARESGARDPGAVAYVAGVKAHGKEKMQELAAAGRRRAAKKMKRAGGGA